MRMLFQYLRLMRLPLVFTAIGDAWAVRWMGRDLADAGRLSPFALPPLRDLALLAAVSFCLYGLGMVLNDVMDARRDAPGKPIPSGGVRLRSANLFAILLAVGAISLAWVYANPASVDSVPASVWVAGIAVFMIVVYDTGAKKAPLVGLLLLGLIRAIHCQISCVAAEWCNGPVWNSLFLFTHVTVVSWIAYGWEDKRPRIRTLTRWGLAFAVIGIDFLLFDVFNLRTVWQAVAGDVSSTIPAMRFLVFPLIVAAAYIIVLFSILFSPRFPTGPDKGRMAMRLGLMWLLAYDAAFCAAAGRWAGVVAMAVLLALTLLTSRAMIALGRKVTAVSVVSPDAQGGKT
ncbi:MAG: hypothetical protein PHU85_06315 [Phycisphaerae bacterium]|nr:hypothetical protein [Phycisphaerae bacterium]